MSKLVLYFGTENKSMYTFFIVSSCYGLQAIKDLNREACVLEIMNLEMTAWVWVMPSLQILRATEERRGRPEKKLGVSQKDSTNRPSI